MELILLSKDPNSGRNGCPSVYLAESGEFVFQVPEVDQDTYGRLENFLPGEVAGRLDPKVVEEALKRWKQLNG